MTITHNDHVSSESQGTYYQGPYVLIPAYNPSHKLVRLIRELKALESNLPIIVVDDGSNQQCQRDVFSQIIGIPAIQVIHHTVNRGKGEALKSGFDYYLSVVGDQSCGIVTADADGQHAPCDIIRLCQALKRQPHKLHLGARAFNNKKIPWRSKFGNVLTSYIFDLFYHIPLQDTQTGLRAIPRCLLGTLLESKLSGYEFELEMLIRVSKTQVRLHEVPIETIYADKNAESHFNPILDSVKIYFVLIRFAAISILSALIDLGLFSLLFFMSHYIFFSMATARIVSGYINFKINQKIAFKAKKDKSISLVKYILLAIALLACSYFLVRIMHMVHVNIYLSKIFSEVILFCSSFMIQKLFIFNNPKA